VKIKRIRRFRNPKFDLNDDQAIVGTCDYDRHPGPISIGKFRRKGCWTCWKYFCYRAPVVEVDAAYDPVEMEELEHAFKEDGRGRLFRKELYDEEVELPQACWLKVKD